MTDVNESLENNPMKERIRPEIVRLFREWGVNPQIATLSGKHWIFEKLLIEACPSAFIMGLENSPSVAFRNLVKANKPQSPKIECMTGFDIGWFVNRYMPKRFNSAWFDYCGCPYGGAKHGFSRIQDPAMFIRSLAKRNRKGLVFITYCLTSRFMSIEAMAEKLWAGLSIEGAIKRRLWSEIGIPEGQGVHLVMEVKYLGGDLQKTPMLTLGFQVGKKTLTPFHADWSIEVKQKRAEIHQAKYGGDFIPPEQLAKLETTISQAKAEWDELSAKLKEIQAKLKQNIVGMEDKELIRFLHQQGFNTAAIHEASISLPQGSTFGGGTYAPRRYFTRRNVGATVAWLK
jgi:hypothetical protein